MALQESLRFRYLFELFSFFNGIAVGSTLDISGKMDRYTGRVSGGRSMMEYKFCALFKFKATYGPLLHSVGLSVSKSHAFLGYGTFAFAMAPSWSSSLSITLTQSLPNTARRSFESNSTQYFEKYMVSSEAASMS